MTGDRLWNKAGRTVKPEKGALLHAIYGQENNATTRHLAIMNLAIRSRKETLFIDARNMGTLIDRVHRELTDGAIRQNLKSLRT